MKILNNDTLTDNLILSSSAEEEVSIKNIAELIAKFFNYENKIEFDLSYSDGQYKKTVNNNKLREYIKDYKITSLNVGLEKTVKWFIDNYDNCRK